MSKTSIEWADVSWNPIRGCTKLSPGCKFCYASRFAERFRGVKGHAYEHGFDLRLVPEMLELPLHWQKPRKIFVNSMSDVFHEGVPDDYIERVVRTMLQANQHTYQVLTKRSARMRQVLSGRLRLAADAPHIWLGVSVEDKKYGLPRIADLQATPATVRFLSIEPLLEDVGTLDLSGISWVIVGGESGPGARPMKREWVVSIRDQCAKGGVPFFFKQWGGFNKKRAGRELDGRTYDEFPPFPEGMSPIDDDYVPHTAQTRHETK